MTRPTRRALGTLLGLVLLFAVTVAVWLLVFLRSAPSGGAAAAGPGPAVVTPVPATSAPVAPTGAPTVHSTPPPSNDTAVFLGDGTVQGLAGGDAVTERWTTAVAAEQGWVEDNLGRAGTGYLATPDDPATCSQPSCPAVPDMVTNAVAAGPDVVVVSAGAADVALLASDRLAVHRAVNRTYRTLAQQLPDTRVIALSPVWTGPGDPPAGLATVAAWVRSAAERYGADFVPGAGRWLAGTPGATSDGELTADGHAQVAAALERWLARHD